MTKSKLSHSESANNSPTADLLFDFGANVVDPQEVSGPDAPVQAASCNAAILGDPPTPVASTAPDPFDPARLRLSQSFVSSLRVKKALVTVPLRKPDKSWFVRVHPSEDYMLQTAVVELKEDRETYLVAPLLWNDL